MDQSTGLDHVPVSRSSLTLGEEEFPKRAVKYGKGKYSKTELVPQPSESTEDPLVGSVFR